MRRILVSGLINIETTLQVEGFPIDYEPVRFPFFGIQSSVSGVGYNVAKALTVLGDDVRFLSLIGGDMAGRLVLESLADDGISAERVITALRQTPQSVILYDRTGRRAINTDLKDIQDVAYPADRFDEAIAGCELAVLCNINFSRPFLARAQAQGVPIATDVHTIADLDDPYNRDFMAAASILFMSDEGLPCAAEGVGAPTLGSLRDRGGCCGAGRRRGAAGCPARPLPGAAAGRANPAHREHHRRG